MTYLDWQAFGIGEDLVEIRVQHGLSAYDNTCICMRSRPSGSLGRASMGLREWDARDVRALA